MLTLAGAVLEKFGGDPMDDVRRNLGRLPRADRPAARAHRSPAGGAGAAASEPTAATADRAHGLTGTDEAGSGGDD